MGNTEKDKSKKCKRKIRIRLKDPNIPDSYVCEILDSSLENEEEETKTNEVEEDPSKPKNYFELLMSREHRKNHVSSSIKENHVLKVVDGEESSRKTKKPGQEVRDSFFRPKNTEIVERKCETDSSDDESLLQIQSRKVQNQSEENSVINLANESTVEEDLNSSNDVLTVFDSQKIELCHKKTLNILNYFSKSETNLKSRVNCNKLEVTVKNSLKTNQTSNSLKPIRKQDSEKTVQSEKKLLLNGINKENVKLAPLFYKKPTKVIDSAKQKARLDFLYKESSIMKKPESKTCESILTFPAVPHVQQRNESTCWSRREICLPLPENQYSDEYVFINNKLFSLQIKNLNNMNHSVTNFQSNTDTDILCKVSGCKYLELNLGTVIDGLKEKQDKFLARAKKIEHSKNCNGQETAAESGYEELNALWTDKYKPKSCEILGNDQVVKKLRKWLQSWKLFDEELKDLAKSSKKNNKKSDDDSDDDFLNFSSQNCGMRAPCNVCFISGPNGCGKTALVYALASELEFSVLELNASSKRTGKKVLSDLQEATQSHKVQRVNLLQTDVLKREPKKKKNHKRKKNKKTEKPVQVTDQANDCKISLILIEDADIVYDEHDEGFFSAIASLVQTSKRPLIFLSNEPNCRYLYNFKSEQCLVLEMEPPCFYSSCAILDVVSALEGARLDKEILESFVRENNFDLRRSLLQLQFWIRSRKNSLEKRFDLGHLWWGLSKFLFKQDISHSVAAKPRKRKRADELFDSSDDEPETAAKKLKSDHVDQENTSVLKTHETRKKSPVSIEPYFRVLDLASTLDRFCLPGSEEPIPGSEVKPKDGLSLEENMEEPSWVGKSVGEEISRELVALSTRIFAELEEKSTEKRKLDFVSPCWEEIRWRNSQEKATEELSLLVSPHRGRDNRSLRLDYLPLLRNICRIERNRSEVNPKRKNRFHHYLNSLGLELTDENLEMNCAILERR